MNPLKVLTGYFIAGLLMMTFSCKKSTPSSPDQNPNPPDSSTGTPLDTSYNPVDPAAATTIGFFLNNWQPKSFILPANVKDTAAFTGTGDVTVSVDMNNVITKVSPDVFGNNSNLWMGQMITQPVLMKYLTDLSPNIIRGPGGSISDVYFWNQSNAAPFNAPDSLFDSNGNKIEAGYWYGKNTQDWTLSIDNYYQMLQQTGSKGMLTVNYGYARYGSGPHPVAAAAHLAADWVRYDNGRTQYWEIGNESNGNWEAGYKIDSDKNQDGQPEIITGDLYGRHFRVFADSMRAAAKEIGTNLYIGAQLLEAAPAAWQDATDKGWNAGVLTEAGKEADFFIVHDYFTPYNANTNVNDILATALSVPSDLMKYLEQQLSQYGVSPKPIALTEWNIRATGAMQNVSFIAGIHATIALGELIKNKFGEASRWDLANGWDNGDDQGMFNIGDEPGGVAKWNPRPAFYYMYYFQKYFGDRMVASSVSGSNDILCYASSFGKQAAGIVLINKGNGSHSVNVELQHYAVDDFYWYLLTGGSDNNGFSRKVFVNGYGPSGISGGPLNYASIPAFHSSASKGIHLTLPPYGVVFMQVSHR